jgi:hypothetical protein
MAIVLKEGKTFSPRNNQGLDLTGSDYYGVIDEAPSYNKKEKFCFITIEVYANQTAREEDKSPVDRITVTFNGNNYDTHIGADGVDIPNAYTKALADAQLVDWKSDE